MKIPHVSPSDSFQSIPEALFFAFRRGEISKIDFDIQIAAWIGENAIQYKPVFYPVFVKTLQVYCEWRTMGRSEYDKIIARKVGDWFFDMFKAHVRNEGNRELLLWAREKLETVKLQRPLEAVTSALDAHRLNLVPYREIDLVLKVKELDAAARTGIA